MGELRHFFQTKLGSWTESFALKCRMKKILVDEWYIEDIITILNGSINYHDGSSAEVSQVPRHNPTSKFGASAPPKICPDITLDRVIVRGTRYTQKVLIATARIGSRIISSYCS